MSVLALVDCNNFFVSCERVFSPALEKRPVVVLSNNDGCVISRSNEAKALGIPMGAPFFEVRSLCLDEKVAVISANHELYVDMSRRVAHLLSEQAEEIETYSIDESFMRVSPDKQEVWARLLKREILRWTGLPVSVGLGPTKTLAKLAADLAKKNGGVLSLCEEGARARALEKLPVRDLWGVAAASARRLAVHRIHTAAQLAAARESAVLDALGVLGAKTAAELRGQACFPLNHAPAPRQSVTVSRSFARPVEDSPALWAAVSTFVGQAGERLRRHHLAAGEVRVYLGWREDGAARGASEYERITPHAATPVLLEAARKAFGKVFVPGRAYKKAGVLLSLLEPAEPDQTLLFDDEKGRRMNRLMSALDGLNARYGAGALSYASAALSRRWAPRSENRSPCYTTRWEDLPRTRAMG